MGKCIMNLTNSWGTKFELWQYGDTYKLYIKKRKLHTLATNVSIEYLIKLAM